MGTWRRRVSIYLVLILSLMVGFTLLYHYGMIYFEGDRSQTIFESIHMIVQTFTTTGYGNDGPWTTPPMLIFVSVIDIAGVALIFIALPVLIVPWFEEALSVTVPTAIKGTVDDHVIICGYTPRIETLIAELTSWGIDYVIIEPDRELAATLYEGEHSVINADPESVEAFSAARVRSARAVVTDTSDAVDVSIVLTAKEAADGVRVISVVDEPERETYHRLAGADEVLSPRELLGESLATKVTTGVSTDLDDAIDVGEAFDIVELPIQQHSELIGRTLAESSIRERVGVNVIGAWYHGEFETPPSPSTVLRRGTILLLAGRHDQLERLKELTLSDVRRHERGKTVVVGYDEVGESAVSALAGAELPYTIIDADDKPGVDVVGDATDPDVLRTAAVDDAQSVILALPDDTVAQYVTLVIRDLDPSVEVIARAEESEAMAKMYRAGAEYVLSLGTVTGRMLASTILEDEEVVSLDTQVEIIRTSAPRLAGYTLADANVRTRTGCTVVAVERNDAVITTLPPDFRIQAGDTLVIAGTDQDTNRFTELLST